MNDVRLSHEYMRHQKTWEELVASDTPPPTQRAPAEVLAARMEPEMRAAQEVRGLGVHAPSLEVQGSGVEGRG